MWRRQGGLDVSFVGLLTKTKEVEVVAVLQHRRSEPGLGDRKTLSEVGQCSALPQVQLAADLAGERVA
jgi:hypothetical protein